MAVLALVLAGYSAYNSLNESKLAYVDINKLMDGYNRTEVERAAFQTKAKQLQSNVDSLIGNWQEELKAYEKERSTLSKKEIELKQELLAGKQQQIGAYQQAIQKQIQEEDQKATQIVVGDINAYVKEYGKTHGFSIIMGATGSGNIMYANEVSDLTEEVLEGLNKKYADN